MSLQKKPPVVTVMGHVDHGKTTLLDYIRKTKFAAKEIGEITQSISAYQIEFKGEKITFIDTPGHEAFSKMRSRGARVADIVVLVVSGSDGIMPQTKESINTILELQVPFLVAITKKDLQEYSADKVKAGLAENNVFVEGYGGNIVALPVSAKTGEGIDQLLEMILLTAELLELKADDKEKFEAEIIESKADKQCGSIVTMVVKNGTLNVGDEVFADGISAKIKMIRNFQGKSVAKAFPSDPISVLGFSGIPTVGSLVVDSASETNKSLDLLTNPVLKKDDKPRLKIILKADVFGSLEAILGCLSDEVQVVEKGVGEVKDSDILLAKTLKAEIYSFNLSPKGEILKLAETEKVKVRSYKIIYDLLKDIEDRVLKIMEPNIDRKVLGKAEILAIFEMKGEKIAGAKVSEGKINKSFPVSIQRGTETLVETKMISLKQGKQDVNEILIGNEFGAVFAKAVDFKPGDVIVSYDLENN